MASWFAGLPPVAGVRAAGGPPADAVVSLRMADVPPADQRLARIGASRPRITRIVVDLPAPVRILCGLTR
jgi:hypothetical protein